eukprot:GHVL01043760.1.p2 GENE.GHVL01043760.1~~GHVL01043760.1.p2  ORF type:complete len:139 (-),score=39.20 GHVL01043760.1:43-459(-)
MRDEENCSITTKIQTHCRDDGSGMKCEKLKKILKKCPGRPVEEIESTKEESSSTDHQFHFLSDDNHQFHFLSDDNPTNDFFKIFEKNETNDQMGFGFLESLFGDNSRLFDRLFDRKERIDVPPKTSKKSFMGDDVAEI